MANPSRWPAMTTNRKAANLTAAWSSRYFPTKISLLVRNLLTFGGMTVVPYKEERSAKKDQVARMFNNISHRYDFLNHFLSLGIDRGWRKKAIRLLEPLHPRQMLD